MVKTATNGNLRQHIASFARISGLWAIAVAQPLFDTLGRAPEFFVAQRADALDLLLLTALLLVAPPAAIAALAALVSLAGRRAGEGVEALAIALLFSVVAVQLGYRAGITGWTGTLVLAGIATVVAGTAWLRIKSFRTFVGVLSLATLVVPLAFLAGTGIRPLLWRTGTQVMGPLTRASAPVVVLVFDEFPLVSLLDENGMIDAARYPNIARLAAEGIWFRNATTVNDFTRWALPALLSGRYPTPGSTPIFDHHPRTLFTLLGRSYRVEAFEPITAICPDQLCAQATGDGGARLAGMVRDVAVLSAYVLLPPQARTSLPPLTANWAGLGGGATPDEDDEDPDKQPLWRRIWRRGFDEDHSTSSLAFVDGIGPGDPQPTLYFMHTLATHHPARWLPSGKAIANRRNIPGPDKEGIWPRDPWPPTQFYQGHLIQAGFADTLVGRTRARLEQSGLYERAVIVITSDHGISFRPGDEMRAITDTNAGDIVPIPLIVKLPFDRPGPARGTIDDRNVESVDILPTVAAALGIDLPWPVDGISALGPAGSRHDKRVYVDDAKEVRRFEVADIAARRAAALDRRFKLLGAGEWPVPSVPGLESLVGRSVGSLPVRAPEGGLRLHVDRPLALKRVDLDARALPVQVAGRIEPVARVNREPISLAVALNGTIVATTRTWRGQAGWSAMLPPDQLRDGENDVAVFLADAAAPDRLMRLPVAARRSPIDVNLLFAGYGEWGVEVEGMYRSEKSARGRFRWTNGSAVVRIPLEKGVQPAELQVELRSGGHRGNELRILVGECPVVTETLSGGPWSTSVSLERCRPFGDSMAIRILSGTHKPERDPRQLGIALTRLSVR